MKIFPAIDIKDKKCVRLIKGDFENKTEYETSPVDQAAKYKDHGFKNLHIVDLDGALTGKTVNLDIIKEIVSKYDLNIEIGGGVRSLNSIKQYIDAGVEKVILGSGAIKNKEFLKEACENFKNQIALPTIIPSIFLLFKSLAFLISLIEETPPEITTGQLDSSAIFTVSSKLGPVFIPSLFISV